MVTRIGITTVTATVHIRFTFGAIADGNDPDADREAVEEAVEQALADIMTQVDLRDGALADLDLDPRTLDWDVVVDYGY